MSRIKTYTPAQQEKLLLTTYPQAINMIGARLHSERENLWRMAKHRGITLGVEQYGDESWHHDMDRLNYEIDCELADAFFYGGIKVAKMKGLIK